MIQLKENSTAASLHFERVKNLIQNRVTNILKKGISRTIKGKTSRIPISDAFRKFLSRLNDEKQLKEIICAPADRLTQIIRQFKNFDKNCLLEDSPHHYILSNIFIAHCYDKIDKLDFIKLITLDTCAYCNRNYTYALAKDKKIKPEIDHFYPQSKYPFLGASFYNMIPSCQTCNGTQVKGSLDPDTHKMRNPYLLKPDSFKFSYDITNIQAISPLADKSVVKVKLINSIPGNMKVFKLGELYEQHSDHVLELIIKSQLSYSKDYRKYLESYTDFKFSTAEIDRMILGNYATLEDAHRRPLAKLYIDIGTKLGLINSETS